jgi:hypothetical protein
VSEDTADREELQKEAGQRLQQCRRQKAMFEADIRECYHFARPHRERAMTSSGGGTDTRPDDVGELSTSLALEVKQDFATEILNTFLSPTQPWAAREVGPDLKKVLGQNALEVEKRVQEDDKVIFQAIAASNFYGALAMAMDPDIAIGTMAMWIDDLRPGEPIVSQAVPLAELEINVGPYGEIDDRFVVRSTRHRYLPALLPGVALPEDIRSKVKKDGNGKCDVRWGFWRDWSDPGAGVVWRHVVMIGSKVIHTQVLRGFGSCPLVVTRFSPDPMYAYGEGPLIQALPELRQLDEMRALSIERVDLAVHPPWTYPDDGGLNFEGGIQPGMGYPMRGNAGDIKSLFVEGDLDAGFIEETGSERRIRRLCFVDRPEQRGDTPPTATQWIDELERSQRKIGTPGAAFWREGPAEIFMRFQHLLEKRGTIEKVEVDGKAWALSPVNPAKRAQDTQEIQSALRLIEIANGMSPQIAQVAIDQLATLQAIKAKLHDTIVVVRNQGELEAAVQQFAPILGGGPGGAGVAPA